MKLNKTRTAIAVSTFVLAAAIGVLATRKWMDHKDAQRELTPKV